MGSVKTQKPAAKADKPDNQSVVLEPTISSLETFIAANGDKKLKSVKAELIGMLSQIKGTKPREVKYIFSESGKVLAVKDYLTGLWTPILDKDGKPQVGSDAKKVGGVSDMSRISTSKRLKLVRTRRTKEAAAKQLLIENPPKTKAEREALDSEAARWFKSACAQEAQSQLDNNKGNVFATREQCIDALRSWKRQPDPDRMNERVTK